MGKKETIEEKAWSLLCETAKELSLIPVDAEYVRERGEYSLLIYVDKEGGVTIDDCEALSRLLDPKLDEMDFISDPYTMIVSSPGLGRTIRRPRDFIFAQGKEVDVSTYAPVRNTKELTGILKRSDKDSIVLETDGEEILIARKDISRIRLSVHF